VKVTGVSLAPTEDVIDALLSPEGWAYASMESVEEGDPGRFHALFGRDSLIFALQMLHRRPEIAAATLRGLAARQGTSDDPEIDERPGKIIHEYRPVAPEWLVEAGWPVRDGGIRYYGTSDATSWFLVVLAATGDAALQEELSANRDAAARWLESALDAGRGFVRCGPREHRGGLTQHGWRDAADLEHDRHGHGIVTERRTVPPPPLADADSQAVAVAALRALGTLEPARAAHWQRRLEALRAQINATFTPDVMAIDGDDRQVIGAGSQLGWLLWAGALDEDAAAAAAARLRQPDILTAYGLRTLSAEHPAFFSSAYHRGGIWPFDNWIGWLGLQAYGEHEAADRVRNGVLEALALLGRYPELYAVTPAGALESIPIANRVQAWTVGAAEAFTNS
jgi:glycogen debranching enzyme